MIGGLRLKLRSFAFVAGTLILWETDIPLDVSPDISPDISHFPKSET